MHVLVVTNMYPPHHEGGYELSCLDVVERFRSRGHTVSVLTTSHRVDGVPWVERSATVRRTLDFYWREHQPWQPGGRDVLALERRVQRELESVLEAEQPDVVSLWNMGAIPLSAITTLIRSERPLVYHVCNEWPYLNLVVDAFRSLLERHRVAGPLAALLYGIPTELPDLGSSGTFCWVSKATWEAAEAKTPWRFPHSTVVHSGISHEDFPPVDPPEARPWRGRLLYVGRIEGTKSTETVVQALPALDGMTVDLVGPGDPRYLDHIAGLAAELGVADRVSVATATRSELRARYLEADAVVFTSVNEPFGLVPIEAMACGTPVVGTASGGSKEFMTDGQNCLTYSPGDAAALARAVQRLAADPGLRVELARGGLGTATTFSVERLTDRLEEAHLEAAARGGRSPGGR